MDNEQILRLIFEKTTAEDVLIVIRYGKQDGKDINVFLIVNKRFNCCYHLLDKLEIKAVGVPNIIFFLNRFDPIVTEPILTGKTLYENILKTSKIKEQLLNKKTDYSTIVHLLRSSREILYWAKKRHEANDPEGALTNFVLALSYREFAHYYEKNSHVITFEELIRQSAYPLLKESYKHLKSRQPIDTETLRDWFELEEK